MPYDFNTNHIRFLNIRDLIMIPYYENIVVATDYNYGLLFWEVECYEKISPSSKAECKSRPLYRLRFSKLGALTALPIDSIS